MNQLICYPHLYLFDYSYKDFWENLPQGMRTPIEGAFNAKTDYCFERKIETETGEEYSVEYLYEVFPLDDSYGLFSACSVTDSHTPQPIDCLRYFRDEKLEGNGNLGKTWMIAGYKPLNSNVTHEDIAKAAYEAVFPKWRWQRNDRKPGQLLGGSVFEVWHPPQDEENIDKNSHVLIIIYDNMNAMINSANYYEDWMSLFCYRNKIIWAYRNSRSMKPLLKDKIFPTVEELAKVQRALPQANISDSDFDNLTLFLKSNFGIMAQSETRLGFWEVQIQTIKTNLYNYEKYLDKVINKAGKEVTNLDLLKNFKDTVIEKYQGQIEQDLGSFRPGLRVREKIVENIRAIVEIEQEKRDRGLEEKEKKRDHHLTTLIGAASLGIGTASVAASAGSALVKDFTPNAGPLFNLLIVLLFSLGLGLIIGWCSLKILQSPPNWSCLRSLIKSLKQWLDA